MRLRPFLSLLMLASAVALPAVAQDHDNPAKPGTHELGATVDGFTDSEGADLYRRACSGCHGNEGGGAYGAAAYPPLAGNPRLASARYPVNLILEGNGAMPEFGDWLDDQQVASLVNYLRGDLGNDYEGTVSAAEVTRMREEFADLDGG